MKKKSVYSLVIMIILTLIMSNIVFAETAFTWDGYGLYNLNKADVTFTGENSNIILNQNQIEVTSEYIIKNNATTDTKLVVGLPYENFDALTISDKGNNVKLTTIMRNTITKAFGAQENIPTLNKWKNTSIYLTAGETRAITLKYTKKFKNDIGGDIAINYLADRKNNIASEIGYADIIIQVGENEPYDVMASGAKRENNQFTWHMEKENMAKINLTYKNVWGNFLKTFEKSTDATVSSLALAYTNKEYSQLIENVKKCLENVAYTELKQDLNILLLAAYKDTNDFTNYDIVYKNIVFSNILDKDLASKIVYDRITMLKTANNSEAIIAEGEIFLQDTALNEGVTSIVDEYVKEAKTILGTESDKKEEEKPADKPKKESFKFNFKLPSLKAINDGIGNFFKDSIQFVKEYTWIVSLIVILIILIIIYMKRKKRRRRTIRFK